MTLFTIGSPDVNANYQSSTSNQYSYNTSSQYTYSPTTSTNEVLTLNLNSPNSNLSPIGSPMVTPTTALSTAQTSSPALTGTQGNTPNLSAGGDTMTLLILGAVALAGLYIFYTPEKNLSEGAKKRLQK